MERRIMVIDNDMFLPLDGESVNEYICRIGALKGVYSFTWDELCDNVYDNFCVSLTPDACRKRAKRLNSECHTITSEVESNSCNCVSSEVPSEFNALQELKMRHVQIQDERTQVNAMYRRLSREETIKDIAKEAAKSIKDIKPLPHYNRKISDCDKEGIVMIGDWHYGVVADSIHNRYSPEIAEDRIAQLRDKIVDKVIKNNISKLYILNLGDMIAGNIHLPLRINSRIDVITQIMQVSELLADFISSLSEYADIEYYSVIDNHSRIDPNKKDAIQLESLCRITDWYLAERLGIEIHQNDFGPTMANFSTDYGLNVVAVHGDRDKPNNIVEKLSTFTHQRIDLICSAHLHHFAANESNCTLHIENGSLMGTDQYAFDLRLNSKPSQTLIVIDKRDIDSINKIDLS